MKCEVITEIEALHDAALTASEAARVRAHVNHCSDCRNALQRLEDLRALLRRAPTPQPSARLDLKVAAAFERHHQLQGRIRSRLAGSIAVPKWAFAASALLIISILGVGVVAFRQKPRIETVRVPVYVDRVVTRTIYVERDHTDASKSAKPHTVRGHDTQIGATNNSYVTHLSLSGFEPPTALKPRVFKENVR